MDYTGAVEEIFDQMPVPAPDFTDNLHFGISLYDGPATDAMVYAMRRGKVVSGAFDRAMQSMENANRELQVPFDATVWVDPNGTIIRRNALRSTLFNLACMTREASIHLGTLHRKQLQDLLPAGAALLHPDYAARFFNFESVTIATDTDEPLEASLAPTPASAAPLDPTASDSDAVAVAPVVIAPVSSTPTTLHSFAKLPTELRQAV